ncbi:MAG TPA: C40 family peptidase [Gemmatimonadales bacterium]|jgi:cell wall-associated NlpC family hydrolase|nr:C40 family peptidase [Gemmatimonadales bacterium]
MKQAIVFVSAVSALLPTALVGQGVSVGAARWLSSPRVSEYRVGLDGFNYGALSFRPTIQYLSQAGASNAAWAGAGGDLIVRTTAAAQPYLIGGVGLGLGRAAVGSLGPSVGAWGGAGAELFTLGSLGLQAEALYTWRSRMQVRSISLGLRIGTRIGRGRAEQRALPAATAPLPSSAPQDEETIRLAMAANAASAPAAGIVGTALSVMGTPYRWGGTDADGFDCSGLIQYTYAQHGITLPRQSTEQAKAGRPVDRRLVALAPGDILTFSSDPGGDTPSHVGLYLGDGRFIHSATGGVQTSVLSAADPAGGWWYARWVGARRVLEQ